MKTKLLFFLFLISIFSIRSQSGLNNLSFENWSATIMGNAPTGWFGSNLTSMTGLAQQGNRYVRISSGQLPGFMMLGVVPLTATLVTGGIDYTTVPVSISGFYKVSGSSTGNEPIMSAYTKSQGSVNAVAAYQFSTNTSIWTSFSAPFSSLTFTSTSTSADSIFIVFNTMSMSSGGMLDLDNLSLQTPTVVATGIDQQSIGTSFLVYPNPVPNSLHVFSKYEGEALVKVYSLDGKQQFSQALTEGDNELNMEAFSAGVYLYRIEDKDGALLLNSKFVLSR